MAALDDIRAGLVEAMEGAGVWQVSGYMLSNPTPPTVHLYPSAVEYDKAMGRGVDLWRMTVQAFVGMASDVGAQQVLDGMLANNGDTSIKALLEADRTLGGRVHSLQVTGCTGYRLYTLEGRPAVLGAEWTVDIYAQGG